MSRLFRSGHDHYLNALRRELFGIETVLELGCGTQSPLTQIQGDFALMARISLTSANILSNPFLVSPFNFSR